MFFENCSSYLNLVFFRFLMFFRTKNSMNQMCSSYFLYPSFFIEKTVLKNYNQIGITLFCV